MEKSSKREKQIRINALNIISDGNIHCVRCGCNDIRLLEINHKNGGGTKEYKNNKNIRNFYRDICKSIRKTDDLEILCKVCNSRHYLELKFGELPYMISYKISNPPILRTDAKIRLNIDHLTSID